jgi:predicted lipoprotein with Yx(FWY)xxD motif
MKRFLTPGAAVAVSLALAACGGGGGGSSDPAASPGNAKTVSVKRVDSIGRVLVNASGEALYSSDVEADGKVHCTGACTSFWEPLTVDTGAPTAGTGVGRLDVIKRPDGTNQVTANGKLLYAFSEDAPGKVEGNGFADDFEGRHFTWNAVLAGGKAAGTSGGASEAPPRNDDGY